MAPQCMTVTAKPGARRPARFTIVLPVRNGGRYLPECVDSILGQSCGDLALEILENGSTDGTAEWLETVQDSRVRVWPAARPLPIDQNWQRAVTLPKGEFLLFMGHDDRLDPGYLSIVDELIRRAPDAALFTTHFRLIDARGAVLRSCRPMRARETMPEFLASRLTSRIDSAGMGVVMRSSAYDALGGIPMFEGLAFADDALWLSLLNGSWRATAPDEAYSYRLHLASAFHSLPWRSAIAATEQYAGFVKSLGVKHADVAEIWRTHAPAFLERRYRFVMLFAMLTVGNGPGGFDSREREAALASLERLSPRAACRLRRRWWFRVGPWAQGRLFRAPMLACLRSYWWYRRRWR
jgi:glycosyltransferase involved in cell wall biosynthesis